MFKRTLITPIGLAVSLGLYIILVALGDLSQKINWYFLVILPQFIIYGYFIRVIFKDEANLPGLKWFILSAILTRLVFLLAGPWFAPEGYFYHWSEQIQAGDAQPIQLSALLDRLLGGTWLCRRLILALAEIALVFVLINLIRRFALSYYRLLLIFFNPLWIVEIYLNGRPELIGGVLLWWAILLFYRRREAGSLLAVGGATLLKFTALPAFLPFIYHKFWRKLIIILLTFAIVLAVFSLSGWISMPGLLIYLNRDAFNGGLFVVATMLLRLLPLADGELIRLQLTGLNEIIRFDAVFLYKVLALIALTVVIIVQVRKLKMTASFRGINYLQSSFIITAALVLLSPVAYPYQLIWIIPYLVFLPNCSWLGLTFLIQLAYLAFSRYNPGGPGQVPLWVVLAEYIPFYLALVMEYRDSQRIKGWF